LHYLKYGMLGAIPALLLHRLVVRDELGQKINGFHGWTAAARSFRSAHLHVRGIGGVVVAAIGVGTVGIAQDGWKAAIPTLHPWSWDLALARADRWLHGGHDPWRLLHPFLGTPALTIVIDTMYWSWYALLTWGLVWQAWNPDRRTRAQFFVAYAMTWILLGTVTAHLLSSVGPCFVTAYLGIPTSFDPLMSYLRSVNSEHTLVAIELQQALWLSHLSGTKEVWMSIAAMPSMHVAIPALFALAAKRVHRGLAIAFWVMTVIVLIGSVHLGWHYAVDGYVAILGAAAIWWLSGRLVGQSG
jgi:hypothetical protein